MLKLGSNKTCNLNCRQIISNLLKLSLNTYTKLQHLLCFYLFNGITFVFETIFRGSKTYSIVFKVGKCGCAEFFFYLLEISMGP